MNPQTLKPELLPEFREALLLLWYWGHVSSPDVPEWCAAHPLWPRNNKYSVTLNGGTTIETCNDFKIEQVIQPFFAQLEKEHEHAKNRTV